MKDTIKERLKFLELCLLLLGQFRKNYLDLFFGIKRAQQTKDIKAYEEECIGNIRYCDKLKRFLPTDVFEPKLLPTESHELLAYQKYVEDLIASKGEESPFHQIEYISQPFLTSPNIEIWGQLNRAITRKLVLSINYSGLRKKETTYSIQPLALVHNGFRWHVRAFVVGEDRYRDFVLSRINQYQVAEIEYYNYGALENDDKWNSTVELVFKPHPKLTPEQAISVEEDYGMTDGKKVVECKLCNIQHLLKLTRTGLDIEQREAHLFPIVLEYKDNQELTNILFELKKKRLL
ncbi:WYL domain-containing protein [Litorilituus lipolyticus]|uniref:WYL domain-containing protein n=1 Tax=Litorilituus lipolyticus TaxID=2491017 RepID=A0A502KSG3_9GAMM|nr:WYL domain-containing protein [Litorilituus lipolyticus]TPH13269.1 WYL domain-containing protein [Litorilituus lipolyticus]